MIRYAAALAAFFVVSAGLAQDRAELMTPRGVSPFSQEVYAERRAKLMDELGSGVIVVHSAPDVISGTQDPDFAYLTGITDEGGAMLVLVPEERKRFREFLFLANRMPEMDLWTGDRLPMGTELSARVGIANVGRMSSAPGTLARLTERHKTLHYMGPIAAHTAPVPPGLAMLRDVAARVPGASVVGSTHVLHAMRVKKEPRELELMKKAILATEAGHRAAMKAVRPGMNERQIQRMIEDEYIEHGAYGVAFPSIVGSGPNTTLLHYERNDRQIEEGELLLADIGAAYEGYAADITRTYPVDGTFNERQGEIYELVLKAQAAAVRALKAGVIMEELEDIARQVFVEAGYGDFMPHGLGHFVGLKVHDAGDYYEPLPAGAVVTIEPGLYLPDENIGVRIEDMYLVTRSGSEHLTSGTPRTVAEIEAVFADRP